MLNGTEFWRPRRLCGRWEIVGVEVIMISDAKGGSKWTLERPWHISPWRQCLPRVHPPKIGYNVYPSSLPHAGLSLLMSPHSPKDRKTPKISALHGYFHTQTIKTHILHFQSRKRITLSIQIMRYRSSTPRLTLYSPTRIALVLHHIQLWSLTLDTEL